MPLVHVFVDSCLLWSNHDVFIIVRRGCDTLWTVGGEVVSTVRVCGGFYGGTVF